MARKKQTPPIDPKFLRLGGLILISLLGVALVVMSVGSLLMTSSFFAVKDIVVDEQAQPLGISDLAKLKGQNIFTIDLVKAEERLRVKYPQLARLRVMRRCPDQLVVSAIKREPFALVSMDGHPCVIDRAGYIIGPPQVDQRSLPVIKGLTRQKVITGNPVEDERVHTALDIVERFHSDKALSSIVLVSIVIDDPARIVCLLGRDETMFFDVIIDKDNAMPGLRMLAGVMARGGLDLALVKYIDLRFGEPVIGQKKVKK